MENKILSNRDPFLDNAKILLILLVVLGHILPFDKGRVSVTSFEWIFSFHMPLFVFISGYFTKIGSRNKFINGVLRLAETYVVFTVIHVCISYYLLGKGINIKSVLLIPQWTLWYLLSLIWWRLILYIIPSSIRNNDAKLIVISVALCLIMGWLPIGKTISFHRTFSFLPFFIIGYIAAQYEITRIEFKYHRLIAFVVMMIVWGGYFILPISIKNLLLQCYGYFYYSIFYGYSPFVLCAFRLGWLLFASLMGLCFLSVVPRKEYQWTRFGQSTLFIYMYHSVILLCFKIFAKSIPFSFLNCILYTIIVLCIIYLMSKVKFFHWLLNPVIPIIYNRKNRIA